MRAYLLTVLWKLEETESFRDGRWERNALRGVRKRRSVTVSWLSKVLRSLRRASLTRASTGGGKSRKWAFVSIPPAGGLRIQSGFKSVWEMVRKVTRAALVYSPLGGAAARSVNYERSRTKCLKERRPERRRVMVSCPSKLHPSLCDKGRVENPGN